MIRKRSEHGLGHLLNPLDPTRDDRDWITDAYQILLEQPGLLISGGGLPWLDLPALTRIAITSSEVARAFALYNEGRPWRDQIKPFNFILHAHIDPFGYPAGVDAAHFRLIAPFESDPPVARAPVDRPLHRQALRGHHRPERPPLQRRSAQDLPRRPRPLPTPPEPKSLDADGHPCTRRSPPGLLARRPVTCSRSA